MALPRTLLGLRAALTALPALATPGGAPRPADGPVRQEAAVDQPTVELLLPPRVRLGDTVAITIRVRNDGSRPAELRLAGRPVAFDIVIRAADGSEVWRRPREGAVGAALIAMRLAPGQAHDFTVRWAQVDSGGSPVAPGRYLVRGVLPAERRRLTTGPRELVIEG